MLKEILSAIAATAATITIAISMLYGLLAWLDSLRQPLGLG